MIKIQEMSEIIGVSVNTLRNWDKKQLLVAHRTPGNQRFYTEKHLEELRSNGFTTKK